MGNTSLYINSNYTSELIEDTLLFWKLKLKLEISVEFGGHNQIFQELLNQSSRIYQNERHNILLIKLDEWFVNDNTTDFEETINNFINALRLYLSISKLNLFVFFTANSPNTVNNESKTAYIQSQANLIKDKFAQETTLFFLDNKNIENYYNVDDYYDEDSYKLAYIPYKKDYFVAIGTTLIRSIFCLNNKFKAIAVDCDNTLWQGVIGEDGIDGISFTEGNLLLHQRLIDLYEAGVLICLCSKNNENDVFEVFEKRKESKLKRNHFLFNRINWLPKSVNINSLANEINIAADSFLFIDDSRMECEEVRTNSAATAILFPDNENEKIIFTNHNWGLFKINLTKEDLKRNQLYQEDKSRIDFLNDSISFQDFIKNLDLNIVNMQLSEEEIPRVSQLTQRTNQFNFTTVRYSEQEVSEYISNEKMICFSTNVSDKFGDYGLVGAVFCSLTEETLIVENMLLSCRAIGKGVEHKMMADIGKFAIQSGIKTISISFISTAKNNPALTFLNEIKVNAFDYKDKGDNIILLFDSSVISDVSFSTISKDNKEKINEIVNVPVKAQKSNVQEQLEIILEHSTISKITSEVYPENINTSTQNHPFELSKYEIENRIMAIWIRVIRVADISVNDNFFDIGGESIFIPQIIIEIKKSIGLSLKMAEFFNYPSIKLLTEFIFKELSIENDISFKKVVNYTANVNNTELKKLNPLVDQNTNSDGIAIIGMAGHFPGAKNIDEYWDNIKNGVESISYFTYDDLLNKGVHKDLLDNPNYVYANGVCEDSDKFDSAFFGFTPKEADFMDPQHRLLLETCYEALEHSGYSSENYEGDISVFAGAGPNNYLLKNLIQHPELLRTIGEFQTVINNDKDYLTTRVSYKLNLTGPSVDIQTACSTSLVAIHFACQSLLNHESDMALSGGVFIQTPRGMGYMHQNGSVFSSDGHCRPFDADASGMLFGEGSGIVVLKRLEDAIRDNDTIWSVIKSTAINNDGSQKAGYMAPSVEGQAKVIAMAQANADIHPGKITYIETHGTGTSIGDPIELGALSKVFSAGTDKKNYCAIGSVKANIGHLDAAAGVAGLIKATMALHYKLVPPSINFTKANPDLNIEESPFYVNTVLKEWQSELYPRNAAVSSFGVGGTNSHAILQEWESVKSSPSLKKVHFLPFSAKSETALKASKLRLTEYLNSSSKNIGDVAYTLQNGRTHHKYRSVGIANNKLEINYTSGKQLFEDPKIVFMYTGQGSQYVSMAKGLYEEFHTFKETIDHSNLIFLKHFDFSLIDVLFGINDEQSVNNTAVAQPLLFVVQYALTKLLNEYGIEPDALIGHSIGEVTAACISGVYSFEDAFTIVVNRGKIMQSQLAGAMLSIHKPIDEIVPLLTEGIEIALNNAPNFCVVSGTLESISKFERLIQDKIPGLQLSKLATSHAFHSYMMEPALDPFKKVFSDIQAGSINIPFISNLSGTWIHQEEATSPEYWAKHIRHMVNFKSGVEELLKESNTIFIEIGPGNTLSTFLTQFQSNKKIVSIPTIRHSKKDENDVAYFLNAISQVWINGGNINWSALYADETRMRIPLPTYPFERRKHWINPVIPFSYDISYDETSSQKISDNQNIDISIEDDDARIGIDNEYIAPENELERDLVVIWQELFGINKIGVIDDFFALGGHSLLAAQLINRINEKLSIELPLKVIFKASNIKELVKEANSYTQVDKKNIAISKIDNISGIIPITINQKGLWIISKLFNSPSYNIPFTYKFKGTLNIEILKESLNILFNRHKILKSYIKTVNLAPQCVISETYEIPIVYSDFSNTHEEQLEELIQTFLGEEIQKKFDIENGPLYRISLIKISENEHIFHFIVHHLVFDGWSWGIFVRELKQIYNNLINKVPVSLSDLPFQYFDFAGWQLKNVNESSYEKPLDYWSNQLKDFSPIISFPLDHKRKTISSGLGGREEFHINAELTNKIKKISGIENTTVFVTVITAFAILLNRYSGDKDINIGIPTANRNQSEIESLIGLFVNTIVLRFKFEEELTYQELLQKTKKLVIDALENQELPFEKLVETLKPPRSFNTNPIYQILFAWQNTPRHAFELENIKSEKLNIKRGVSPLDLTFYMWENNGIIEGEIEFSTDLFERETILKLKDVFLNLIKIIFENPNTKINTLENLD
jgi:FkbH-like protein